MPTHKCDRSEFLMIVNSMYNISAISAIIDYATDTCYCQGSPVKSHNVLTALSLIYINSGKFVCCIEIGLEVIDSNTHNAYLVCINLVEVLSTGTRSQPCQIVGSNPLNVHSLFNDARVCLIDSHLLQANYATKQVSPVSPICLLDI